MIQSILNNPILLQKAAGSPKKTQSGISPIEACYLFTEDQEFISANSDTINDIIDCIREAATKGELNVIYGTNIALSAYSDKGVPLLTHWTLIARYFKLCKYHVVLQIHSKDIDTTRPNNFSVIHRDIIGTIIDGATNRLVDVRLYINWFDVLDQLVNPRIQ